MHVQGETWKPYHAYQEFHRQFTQQNSATAIRLPGMQIAEYLTHHHCPFVAPITSHSRLKPSTKSLVPAKDRRCGMFLARLMLRCATIFKRDVQVDRQVFLMQ